MTVHVKPQYPPTHFSIGTYVVAITNAEHFRIMCIVVLVLGISIKLML